MKKTREHEDGIVRVDEKCVRCFTEKTTVGQTADIEVPGSIGTELE